MNFFQAPQIRPLEFFTSLPAKFRKPQSTIWGDANQGGRESDSFLEGPVFDAAGNLYVTDIPFGRVFRIDAKGDWELIAQWEGEPNGMKFLNAKELLITDYLNGLMLLDIVSGQVRPYLARRNTESFKGVNDLTFDSSGNLYFTDQGQTGLHDPTGRVYRLSKAGKLDLLLSNVPSPNGIVLSLDEKFLFVAATRGNCVWRMPLQSDGTVSKAGQFFTSHGPSGPDGLALDMQGRLLVANPGLGGVWVLDKLAQPVQWLAGTPGHSITNLAFGGANRQRLCVTDSTAGQVLFADLEAAGAPVYGA